MSMMICSVLSFFFQAEDGIRDRSPSRGLGDVYKRQVCYFVNVYVLFGLSAVWNTTFRTCIMLCLPTLTEIMLLSGVLQSESLNLVQILTLFNWGRGIKYLSLIHI